eukprot:TRINITY_DN4265_c0_g1_i1.p1 TRINITY_DN4265_c0_g1~~TRINITY_DN4265_c0_g1_i1.p1  ORF type:complete len:338 (+),score=84.93 TRINITY_DN4265_c0_g1_i1:55-1014(+)
MTAKITIIGSGLIGRSWAIVFSRGGYNVCLYDVETAQLETGLNAIKKQLVELEQVNLLKGQEAETVFSRVSSSINLSKALEGAIHVQECVPENLSLKKKVFAELDANAPPNAVLASSTSSTPCSKFTEELKGRSRCIVAHPVNPPYLVPLVELVPAPWTDKSVLDQTKELLDKVGQVPIVLNKEINGFVQPRLQYALIGEAFRLVEDGVLSPEDVDKAVAHGLAGRWSFMGVFQTCDLNAPGGIIDYCNRYLNDPICRVLEEQDNNRKFSVDTVKKIDEAMRKKYKVEDIPVRSAWRDKRLMAYAQHQAEDEKIDRSFF